MKLPQLSNFDFKNKTVLVRCDLDVPLNGVQRYKGTKVQRKVENDERIRQCLPTIKYLLDCGAKIILLGHLGRPEGKVVPEFSLRPVAEKLAQLLNYPIIKLSNCELGRFGGFGTNKNLVILENLRFFSGEENNDLEFAKELAGLGDFYINEAFAASHREHASIVGIPQFLPHAAGLHFAKEVENLSKVLENPKRPVVFVVGGAKPETKLPLVADLARKADTVLVGGTLCQNSKLKTQNPKPNVKCAQLTKDGFDISEESIKEFARIVGEAGTVVWNGPMGKYEDERWKAGTKKIAEAIGNCKGFRVVGGGDTIVALKKFNLIDKMDYISTGGGAMLEFLAKGTLPGIEALIN